MDAPTHPDEVERLSAALWGDAAGRADAAALHAQDCAACGEDVAFHRRIRDAFRRWTGAAPSEGAMALARAAARGPDEPREIDWILAVPIAGVAGARSSVAVDVHVVAAAGDFVLDVVLQFAGTVGRFAVTGQASLCDAAPAPDVDVALFVDRRCVAGTVTDAFGEFAFGPFAGERWGLRLGAGADAEYVELVPGAGAR